MVRNANICYTRNANIDLLCLGMQTFVTLRDEIMCHAQEFKCHHAQKHKLPPRLEMQFVPSVVVSLVISLFHTEVSIAQPAHASTNKAKVRSQTSGAKNRSLRKWSPRKPRTQPIPCNSRHRGKQTAKRKIGLVKLLCHVIQGLVE